MGVMLEKLEARVSGASPNLPPAFGGKPGNGLARPERAMSSRHRSRHARHHPSPQALWAPLSRTGPCTGQRGGLPLPKARCPGADFDAGKPQKRQPTPTDPGEPTHRCLASLYRLPPPPVASRNFSELESRSSLQTFRIGMRLFLNANATSSVIWITLECLR